MRILVVDDEPAVREAVERALRLDGHDVVLAADGGEALASLGERPPDAVVLDVLMPRVDGLALCRRMRQRGDRTPVLMLTARDAGADALIDKAAPVPVLFEQLRMVARGGRVLPSPSARALTSAARELDAAERVVFGMCVYGVTLEEISRTLRRDPLEVETTVRELIRRLARQPPHAYPPRGRTPDRGCSPSPEPARRR